MAHVVLDDGPIQHANLERYDDLDIETGLEQAGYDAETATYRLIEVDMADMEDTRWFPGPRPWGLLWWKHFDVESDCPRLSSRLRGPEALA